MNSPEQFNRVRRVQLQKELSHLRKTIEKDFETFPPSVARLIPNRKVDILFRIHVNSQGNRVIGRWIVNAAKNPVIADDECLSLPMPHFTVIHRLCGEMVEKTNEFRTL